MTQKDIFQSTYTQLQIKKNHGEGVQYTAENQRVKKEYANKQDYGVKTEACL